MEVLERDSGDNASGIILDCEDGSINFRDVFFGCRGLHNGILHRLVYSFVEIHVHEDTLYYHITSGT